MLVKELLDGVDYEGELEEIEIKDIKIDSRTIEEGDIFIALHGRQESGEKFINDALKRGARIVLSEEENKDKRVIKVASTRSAYALVCKNFFDKACDNLKIIAITGTNGKTTTATITKEVLGYAGLRTAVIGTLGAGEKELQDTGFTTPDPYALHRIFKEMYSQGVECVVMEASAHALALHKLDGIKFEIGVLTNVTEDHLDFFGDMGTYAQAKFKLFEPNKIKLGIVCCDDIYGRKLFANAKVPMVSYGLGEGNDITAFDIENRGLQTQFVCKALGREFKVTSPLVGDYNVENMLACVGSCMAMGVPIELIRLGLSCVNQVEGRFNVITMGGVKIVIDFAHTPDGLEKVLLSARKLTGGHLKVLFGCGGDRDRLKRPIMGKVAEDFADEVYLTSDNPRFENPEEIMKEIASGMSKPCKMITNRKDAIRQILSSAQIGDTIVLAGKGGEKYQDINGEKLPYNDFDEVYLFYRNKIKEVENE